MDLCQQSDASAMVASIASPEAGALWCYSFMYSCIHSANIHWLTPTCLWNTSCSHGTLYSRSVCLITARLDYSFIFFLRTIFCLFVFLYQAIFPNDMDGSTFSFFFFFSSFQHLPLWIYKIERFAFEDCDALARETFLIVKYLLWVKENFNYTFRASWDLTYLKHCVTFG